MASTTFTMHQPDASTMGLSVIDLGTLFDGAVRAKLEQPAGNPVAWAVGDAQEIIQPLSFTIVVEASSEAAAFALRETTKAFLRASAYLQEDTSGFWLALRAGDAIAPGGWRSRLLRAPLHDAYQIDVMVMPVWPRWTSVQPTSRSVYTTGTKA